jgi:hypothetical protein
LYRRIETDEVFESRFLQNAEHFLFDLEAFKLEDELSFLQVKKNSTVSGTE